MTADYEKDEIIEELRTGLREQQSMLAAQAERITLLEGERRSPSTARPREDESPERRPRRLTRGGMLKAAAMGAIGLAGAEAASTLGAESAFADTGSAPSYTATGPGESGTTGFLAPLSVGFEKGGDFEGLTGVVAHGTQYTGVYAISDSSTAVNAISHSLPDNGSVILGRIDSSASVGSDVVAVQGQVDRTDSNGTGVYGSHAGDGFGVLGNSAGAGNGVGGGSATGSGVYGTSATYSPGVFSYGEGVRGYSQCGIGVFGQAGDFANANGGGYGGRFEITGTGLSQLLLTPFGSGGRPTNGTHTTGEIFMDPNGNLFVCTAAGSPGTWKQVAYTGGGPTDARLRHFTIARHADRVDFHWRMADGKGVAGFELYAAGHRLNRETIRPHRAKTYDASATRKGNGPFALHVLLRDGNVIVVRPE